MDIANSHFLPFGIYACLFGSTFMMSIRFLRQAVAYSLVTLLVSAAARLSHQVAVVEVVLVGLAVAVDLPWTGPCCSEMSRFEKS